MIRVTRSAFALGYSRSDYPLCGAAIAFAGSLELLQLFVPTRHARLSDFVIDALAAVIGIALSGLVDRNKLLPLGPEDPTGVLRATPPACGSAHRRYPETTIDLTLTV